MTELRNIVRKKNEAILLGPSSRVDLAQDQAFFSLEGDATRLPAPCSSTPYTTVYITPTWGGFPSSIVRKSRGCRYRTIRLRKALGETFPTSTFSAPALFQL